MATGLPSVVDARLRLVAAGKPPAHEELDMAKYDPDRVTPENFAHDDPEVVEGNLDHLNTIAMHEQLGLQSRASTPQERIPVIEKMLATDRDHWHTRRSTGVS